MSASSVTLSLSTVSVRSKRQKYLDSLIPPSREEFERIARIQAEREEQTKRRLKEQRRRLDTEHRQEQGRDDTTGDWAPLDPTTRWITVVEELQFRELTRPKLASTPVLATGSNLSGRHSQETASSALQTGDPRSAAARMNWKKIGMIARRAGHDNSDSGADAGSGSDSGQGLSPQEYLARERAKRLRDLANAQRRQTALTLGLQYWLEIIDAKHRYGTNLRMYHEEWRKADTSEGFFTWLDHGEGRFISLQTCSREQLERDQVRYLSREERRYYLAVVDDQGRICWAKNRQPIDTSSNFKDSRYGIVPADDDTTPVYERPPEDSQAGKCGQVSIDPASATTTATSASTTLPGAPGTGTGTGTVDDTAPKMKKVFQISATSAFDKLLRKFVRDGTWIFVADTSFRLYVGIKQAGTFQHSSFLQGGRISAGGLIGIKEGRLTSLSPLSGHYRPPTSNFRGFVRSLEAEGVDVSGVPVFKSFAVLYGLETYLKAKKGGRGLCQKVKGLRGRGRAIKQKDNDKVGEKG